MTAPDKTPPAHDRDVAKLYKAARDIAEDAGFMAGVEALRAGLHARIIDSIVISTIDHEAEQIRKFRRTK